MKRNMTTLWVTPDLKRRLILMKEPKETFDSLLRRLLKLPVYVKYASEVKDETEIGAYIMNNAKGIN